MKKQKDSIQTEVYTTKGQEIARTCKSTFFNVTNLSSNFFSALESYKVIPSHSCKGINDCKQNKNEKIIGKR